jgi:hypothetical protein
VVRSHAEILALARTFGGIFFLQMLAQQIKLRDPVPAKISALAPSSGGIFFLQMPAQRNQTPFDTCIWTL